MNMKKQRTKRTETNSDSVSSYGVSTSSLLIFSYQDAKNAKQERFLFGYLRRNVDSNLRSSAFICGFVLPGLFFLRKHRRTSNGLISSVQVVAAFHSMDMRERSGGAQMLFEALACYPLEKSYILAPDSILFDRFLLPEKNEIPSCDYETFISNINVLNPKKVILW